MNAEDAGIDIDHFLHGGERRPHFFRCVGDQRRQQRRRAELAMRGGDGANAFDRRHVVEQDVAAAIDLHVDEAGREPCAIRQVAQSACATATSFAGRDRDDACALDDDRGVAVNDGAVEHIIRCDGVLRRRAHRVRVTFCKWRGRLTSSPRRSAMRIASA